MPLPVDIGELLKEAVDLSKNSDSPIAVSLLIDEGARELLASHVRSLFTSEAAHARVTISYLSDGRDERQILQTTTATPGLDMVAIVAGDARCVGSLAASLRVAKVPVCVITDDPSGALRVAAENVSPIPEEDVIAYEEEAQKAAARQQAQAEGEEGSEGEADEPSFLEMTVAAAKGIILANPEPDPDSLDEDAKERLDKRLCRWILATCSAKKLSFARAFPFVRHQVALDCVTTTAIQNGAIGVIPLIPGGVDMPLMTLNQSKMVLQIATAYGKKLDAQRIKEIAAVVAGGFFFRGVARSLVKYVPVGGWAVSGGVGYTGTVAMGRAAVNYFEGGGNISGLANVIGRVGRTASNFAKDFVSTPAGARIIGFGKSAAKSAATAITRLRSNDR